MNHLPDFNLTIDFKRNIRYKVNAKSILCPEKMRTDIERDADNERSIACNQISFFKRRKSGSFAKSGNPAISEEQIFTDEHDHFSLCRHCRMLG